MAKIDDTFDILGIRPYEVVPPSDELRYNLKQALYTDMLELIKDEQDYRTAQPVTPLFARNQLKAELRTKIKEYYGISDEDKS